MSALVCAVEGARVAQARSGKWLHVESLPEHVDADHEVDPIPAMSFEVGRAHAQSLNDAAVDMLRHHDTLHPGSDCEWALRLWEALRR